MLARHVEYLHTHPEINLRDLAFTLQHRRSTLPFRKAIAGTAVQDVRQTLEEVLASSDSKLDTRYFHVAKPRILAVFTGQGAQWPRMGAVLVESSDFVRARVADLDASLASLPESDRPQWTIQEQLKAAGSFSRVTQAAVSQPLCTAIQVILVDLLQAAGVQIHGVIGHSSGEIGAAYAAGFISASDAIRIAYYRGLHTKLASSPNGASGAMAAVGTSWEKAEEFCRSKEMQGRIQVAAYNSSSSVTLSGDEEAIDKAVEVFTDQQKFARRLKVDMAYHSVHMNSCSVPYLDSLERWCQGGLQPTADKPVWLSSVFNETVMSTSRLSADYWVHNMIQPVLFASAVKGVLAHGGEYNAVIEIGPHAALKGPTLDNLAQAGVQIPYTGLLSRGKNDVNELSTALGFLWTHLGVGAVNFDSFDRVVNADSNHRFPVNDLPSYPFNHQYTYWAESRISRAQKKLTVAPHPLLGKPCVATTTSTEIRWKNILTPSEIPWLHGHQLQGQIIFPATGYVVMAIEAMMKIAEGAHIAQFNIMDMILERAMIFNDEHSRMESLFSVKISRTNDAHILAEFICFSTPQGDHSMTANAKGRFQITLSQSSMDDLPVGLDSKYYNLVDVDVNRFYSALRKIGYEYAEPFRGMKEIKRRLGFAQGTLIDQSTSEWEDELILHPGMLDTALQTLFAAFSYPGDQSLRALHIPVRIDSLKFNPHFHMTQARKKLTVPWETTVRNDDSTEIKADLHLFTEDAKHPFLQIEGITLKPFSPPRPENDVTLFSKFVYLSDGPDGELAAIDERLDQKELRMIKDMERLSFYYIRRLSEMSIEDRANALPHHQHLLAWADYIVGKVARGEHPCVEKNCLADTDDEIKDLTDKYSDRVDALLIESTGQNLPTVIRERDSILQHMTRDDLLGRFYKDGVGLQAANWWLANMAKQVSHRYPRMKILEIGAGTGGSTQAVLPKLGPSFSTYTYTDISSGFFEEAEEKFREFAERMVFKTFDMQRPPAEQGFEEGTYDMVLASNVLHVADPLENMMTNVRRLLKPGGFLVNLETVTNEILRNGVIMGGLPGWWIGANNGRPHGPMLDLNHWDSLLKQCQFGGIDTATPVYDQLHAVAVWTAQAIDPRLQLLRNPTTSLPPSFATDAPPLVLIGGSSLTAYMLVEKVSALLSPVFPVFTRVLSIESLHSTPIPVGATVLSLSEFDEPLMQQVTVAKIEALKTLWSRARNILWVSKGARTEQPYSYMMLGIGRVVKFEQPNINLQFLDLNTLDEKSGHLIAETLLRHQLLDDYSRQGGVDDLLWSSEPEIFVENGRMLIPRLYPDTRQNLRVNSSRRQVLEHVDPATANLKLVENGMSVQLEEASPPRTPESGSTTDARAMIRIRQSLLQFIKLEAFGSCMLFIGSKEDSSSTSVISLTQVSDSLQPVDPASFIDLPSSSPGFGQIALRSVGAFLVAQAIVSLVRQDGSILVHEADNEMKSAISQAAQAVNIETTFTTCHRQPDGAGWTWIHHALPARILRQRIPRDTSVFVSFARPDGQTSQLANAMEACLPAHCVVTNAESFFSNKLTGCPGSDSTRLGNILQTAWKSAMTESLPIGVTPLIPLSDVHKHCPTREPLQAVDWTVPSVPIRLRPMDQGILFRSDRTYLLVGLAGEVGQSICHWMAQCGAGCVVLTSRNPTVDPEFIDAVERCGTNVRVMSLDVTSRDSLNRCVTHINRNMPPIGGVANGALILDDRPFEEMTLDSMTRVLKPKVEGSKLLDELFHDTPLEFFIMFSSLTACLGNGAQSNYAAANMFMTALAFQRHRRGVAASVIDLSALMGIGNVGRSDVFDPEYFAALGATAISETDLHKIFAVAVSTGTSASVESAEVVTGLSPVYVGELAKDQYRNDIKFSHLTFERINTQDGPSTVSTLSVRALLQDAKCIDHVEGILKSSFTTRIKKLLQIPADETVDENSTLIELGVDSLIAIDVRTWFMKELDVDQPVLKILGGATVAGLIHESIEKIPATVIDISRLSTEVDANFANSVKHEDKKVEPPARESEHLALPDNISATQRATTPSSSESVDGAPSTDDTSVDSTSWRDVVQQSSTEITAPMSFGQTRFWYLHHALQDKSTFNVAISIHLSGPIQVENLSRALQSVGERHEAMRTRYLWAGEEEDVPTQGILSRPLIRLESRRIHDKSEVQKSLNQIRDHVWNMSDWESMRFLLLSLSNTEHWLIFGSHHITLDGISIQIIFGDLEKAYLGKTLSTLSESSQYRCLASQQHRDYETGRFQKSIDFHKNLISRDIQPMDLFSFAKVQQRQPQVTYGTFRADVRLQAEDTTLIKRVARQNHSTNFHLYTAVLQVLLFRLLPSADELFIGIADANRISQEFMETVGFFLNLVPIRLERSSIGSKFDTVVKAMRNKVYESLEHSALPFDVLLNELGVNRSANAPPIFQVFVDYRQGTQERASFANCKAEGEQWYHPRTGYDISLDILENPEGDTLLTLQLQESLYTIEHAETLLRAYVNLLHTFTKTPDVDVLVDSPTMWAPDDVSSALKIGTGPAIPLQWAKTVSHRVDEIIRTHSFKPALKDGRGVTLTFEEMGHRIDSIAETLFDAGLSNGSVIGVMQEHSVDWICSMLAIFRVDATYLPLDVRNSIHRVRSAVKAAQPTAVLVDNNTAETVETVKPEGAKVINVCDVASRSGTLDRSANIASPDSIAVILFTSGTTSEPKGIRIRHSNLVAQNEGFSQQLDTLEDQLPLVVLQQSAFSFDFSLEQTFVALCNGGCLLVVPSALRGDPGEITTLMKTERVTYTSGTPSEYGMWFHVAEKTLGSCSQWQYAFFGGEPFADRLVQEFRSLALPSLRIFNNYGPGETTIACTSHGQIDYRDSNLEWPLCVGFAAPNYAVYIVDEHLQPLPIGIPGEVVVGGAGVSAGYLGLDEVTRQKFLPFPFAQKNENFLSNGWSTVYRTGDRGFLRDDGALFLAGRIDGDTQVKLRGFRIELAEIETALVKNSDGVLTHAVVTLRGSPEDGFLVAHVVFAKDHGLINHREFLDQLQATLPVPDYMRPAFALPLDELPLTEHSKVNRAAIQDLAIEAPSTVGPASLDRDMTTRELQLEALWRIVLPASDLRSIGPATNFFHIGGSSLLLVRLQRLIKDQFKAAPKLNELMNAGRLGDMTSVVEANMSSQIDWDAETSVPEAWESEFSEFFETRRRAAQGGVHILLTGATGYLGRHLLPSLVKSDQVSKISCLVRRGTDVDAMKTSSEKISVLAGDLAEPNLGLNKAEFDSIADEADLILHFAANRSFWDDYEVLRSVNLLSVKEMARLALRRRIPLHFFSSGAIRIYEDRAALQLYEIIDSSVDNPLPMTPPSNGSDGYVASKWAADRFLKNVAEHLQLPVTLHRPVPVPGLAPDADLAEPETDEMLSQLVAAVKNTGVRPMMNELGGWADTVPMRATVDKICEAVFGRQDSKTLTIVDHPAERRINWKRFIEAITTDPVLNRLPTMPTLLWIGEAKRAGFSYMMPSHRLILKGDTVDMISRR
ncbi:hypothetical protein BDW42DRAFT_127060 [Aspergillus taichungensis]|uniref:Carrier domain-containing protein n=1 Tax=Aspergillus taichungensis TaxID=482145 RepID=A0A2J5HQE3_9EURO|nr:hypothetical protein BDW42DRAFT_127060 [Aspergillus taichungensis]